MTSQMTTGLSVALRLINAGRTDEMAGSLDADTLDDISIIDKLDKPEQSYNEFKACFSSLELEDNATPTFLQKLGIDMEAFQASLGHKRLVLTSPTAISDAAQQGSTDTSLTEPALPDFLRFIQEQKSRIQIEESDECSVDDVECCVPVASDLLIEEVIEAGERTGFMAAPKASTPKMSVKFDNFFGDGSSTDSDDEDESYVVVESSSVPTADTDVAEPVVAEVIEVTESGEENNVGNDADLSPVNNSDTARDSGLDSAEQQAQTASTCSVEEGSLLVSNEVSALPEGHEGEAPNTDTDEEAVTATNDHSACAVTHPADEESSVVHEGELKEVTRPDVYPYPGCVQEDGDVLTTVVPVSSAVSDSDDDDNMAESVQTITPHQDVPNEVPAETNQDVVEDFKLDESFDYDAVVCSRKF
eukprot:GILK01003656.1.p1 GENE.GILK01003656.1~~GILK01003656.1.p1  ORF type:complete len:417 (+),score=84.54 GILK01003656.1:32-1282(+)